MNARFNRTINETLGLLEKISFKYTLTINEKIALMESATLIKNYVYVNFGYGFDISVYY